VLNSIGFREEEGGILELPLDVDVKVLAARKLELEVGLETLNKEIRELSKSITPSSVEVKIENYEQPTTIDNNPSDISGVHVVR